MKKERVANKIVHVSLGILFLASVFVASFSPQDALAYRRVCDSFSCWTVACDKNADCGTNGYTGSQQCQGNNVYQNYVAFTCNNAGGAYASCTSTTTSQLQQTCPGGQPCSNGKCTDPKSNQFCTYHASKKCVGNSVYWYDSCGKQQDVYQNCVGGQTCSQGLCTGSSDGSIKGCIYNKVYLYDSAGNAKSVYQDCSATGAKCQDGVCVGGTQVGPPPPPPPSYTPPPTYKPPLTPPPPPTIPSYRRTYVKHYNTDCFDNDIYWFDSNTNMQDVYLSCNDNNQCTQDVCENNQCENIVKCDNSDCKNNKTDFEKYCQKEESKAEPTAAQKAIQAAPKNSQIASFFSNWYVWVVIGFILLMLFVIIFRGFSNRI